MRALKPRVPDATPLPAAALLAVAEAPAALSAAVALFLMLLATIPDTDEVEDVAFELLVLFSNNTCGLAEMVVMKELDVDEASADEVAGAEVVEIEELEGEGVGVGVGVGVALAEGAALESSLPLPVEGESASPALNTTILAWPPFGTVTTQKFPPPAPLAERGLFTSLILFTEGSMEQGRPLQPPPGHSTRMPHLGSVVVNLEIAGSR
jgi:hypothetical protein